MSTSDWSTVASTVSANQLPVITTGLAEASYNKYSTLVPDCDANCRTATGGADLLVDIREHQPIKNGDPWVAIPEAMPARLSGDDRPGRAHGHAPALR